MTMKKLSIFFSILLLLTACGKSEDENPWVTQIVPEAPTTPETPDNPGETPDNPNVNPDEPDTPDIPIVPDEGTHEYVDLGLPSGTLWATTNVGAALPADYGDYFAWGETSPKTTYGWSPYKWSKDLSSTLTKYNISPSCGTVDNKMILESADDAATANWGSGWRMPTHEEQEELMNTTYCTWTWTSKINSVGETINGYEVKSRSNGNSIFLPAAGGRVSTSLDHTGINGNYWSSSLYADLPYYAHFLGFILSGNQSWNYSESINRPHGLSVRPVRASTGN